MTSIAEQTLAAQLDQAGIPYEREYRFAPPRRYRADFWIPVDGWEVSDSQGNWVMVGESPGYLIEVEGGTWVEGRHSRGSGFESDCEKQALAVIAGYRYMRVTSAQVEDGRALSWIRQALGQEEAA